MKRKMLLLTVCILCAGLMASPREHAIEGGSGQSGTDSRKPEKTKTPQQASANEELLLASPIGNLLIWD